MRRSHALSILSALCAALAPLAASATAQRTFVASTGNDANPCTIAQPCRTFAAAIAQTSASGEVIVLDSAGYGPVTITRPVSIVAPPGIFAGVSVPSGAGIAVNAGANDIVVLRGLTITGQGGVDGIDVDSAGQVHIENCTISNMSQEGVRVNGGGYVRIAGTTIRSNGLSGVFVPPGVTTTLMVDNTVAAHNGQVGYFLNFAGQATLHDSQALDNTGSGVRYAPPSGASVVTVNGGEYSGNGGDGFNAPSFNQTTMGLGIHGATVSRNGTHGFDIESTSNPPAGTMAASISGSYVTWNGFDGLYTGSIFNNVDDVRIFHSTFSENNSVGVVANGAPGTIVSISGNTITRNGDFDLQQTNSGQLFTFGNNATTGGASDIGGSLTGKSLQ